MVLLVKPQFEAGRQEVGRGRGVITDPAIHDGSATSRAALERRVRRWSAGPTSPITGADGNREFLVHATARAGGAPMTGVALVAHHERDDRPEHAIDGAVVRERARAFWMPAEDAEALGLDGTRERSPVADADLVLSLGGDGTMLRAVHLLEGAPCRCSASTSGRSAT